MKNPNINPILETIDKKGVPLISSIVAQEYLFGGYNSSDENEINYRKAVLNQFKIMAFDEHAADLAARIESELSKRGQTIGRADAMIATTVHASGSSIIYTRNDKHFHKIDGLDVVSWKRK